MHTDKYIQALVSDQEFFQIHRENVLGSEMDVFKNRPRSLVDFLSFQIIMATNHILSTKIRSLLTPSI